MSIRRKDRYSRSIRGNRHGALSWHDDMFRLSCLPCCCSFWPALHDVVLAGVSAPVICKQTGAGLVVHLVTFFNALNALGNQLPANNSASTFTAALCSRPALAHQL
jgi:hypothetical protein